MAPFPALRVAVATAMLVGVFSLTYSFQDSLSLDALAHQEASLRELQQQRPVLVYAAALALYVFAAALSLPITLLITFFYGWYFGFWGGVILVSVGSAIGALLAFWISRYLLHDWLQARFGKRLAAYNQHLEQEGAYYLFTLRLLTIPYWIINLVMGLTPIKARTFLWVTFIGMLPGTMIYSYVGSVVPDLRTLADEGVTAIFTPWQMGQFFLAFAALGVLPLLGRLVVKWRRKKEC